MAEYVVLDKEQLEADLTTVADAIREKGGTSEPLAFPQDMADAVNALPDAESGGESFFGLQTSVAHSFYGVDFGGGFEMVINLGENLKNKTTSNGTAFMNAFGGAKGLKKISIINHLTFSKKQSMITMFGCETADNELIEVDISSILNNCIISSLTACFKFRKSLQSVIGVFDFSGITGASDAINPFQYCEALVDVRFKQNTINYNLNIVNSPLLSNESIQSIIDGLADLTGEESQTITFHSDVNNKLTKEQADAIVAKYWVVG